MQHSYFPWLRPGLKRSLVLLLSLALVMSLSGEAKGRRLAIVIGVPYISQDFPELVYPADDAAGVAESLHNLGYDEVQLLVSNSKGEISPTMGTILATIQQYASAAKGNDSLFVYMAGHGLSLDLAGGKTINLFLPEGTGSESLAETSIDLFSVLNTIQSSRAGRKILIVDAGRLGQDGLPLRLFSKGLAEMPPKAPGTSVFLSSTRGSYSYEPPPGEGYDEMGNFFRNSLFTHFLIRGLDGEAADMDGNITARRLKTYIENKLNNYTLASGLSLRPYIQINDPDIHLGTVKRLPPPGGVVDNSSAAGEPVFKGPSQAGKNKKDYITTETWSGLVWKTCTEEQTGSSCSGSFARKMMWSDAVKSCQALNLANGGGGYGGYREWRLPEMIEMELLLNFRLADENMDAPLIDLKKFPGTMVGYMDGYWTATPLIYNGKDAGPVVYEFGSGISSASEKTEFNYVRCVSGKIRTPAFQEGPPGTVFDSTTRLTWQKCSMGQTFETGCSEEASGASYSDGRSYCENLTLGGRADWRLPSNHELNSILDASNPVENINKQVFPGTPSALYWSGSSIGDGTAFAVSFGASGSYGNPSPLKVRCVAGP